MVPNDLPIKVLVHDLKNPLILIMAGARSLLSKQDQFGALTDKQKRVINRIKEEREILNKAKNLYTDKFYILSVCFCGSVSDIFLTFDCRG